MSGFDKQDYGRRLDELAAIAKNDARFMESVRYARFGEKSFHIVVTEQMARDTGFVDAVGGFLYVGPDTDLHKLFFHMNMTPRDKRLLAAMKIGL
jgi:hypothetical protein